MGIIFILFKFYLYICMCVCLYLTAVFKEGNGVFEIIDCD